MKPSLKTTTQVFATLRSFHGKMGDWAPCTWDVYRKCMTEIYEVDGDTLDAIQRLGHFHISGHGVRFVDAY